MYLENIYSPEDVKKLSIEELDKLSGEIRAALLQKLREHGDRKSTRLNSSHDRQSRMPSSA